MCRASWALTPSSRPATTRLAARRLRSNSNGPGMVSSKSLMSKSKARSGEANSPKFERCASPQSWTVMPEFGPAERSDAIGKCRAAIEGERRDRHPAIADRHEILQARGRLALQQLDRVDAIRIRRPRSEGSGRRTDPGLRPRRGALLSGWQMTRRPIAVHLPRLRVAPRPCVLLHLSRGGTLCVGCQPGIGAQGGMQEEGQR